MISRADAPRRPVDARLRSAIVAVVLCGAALTLGARIWVGSRAALSVAVGAALAALNLWALARIVSALLPEGESAARTNGASAPDAAPAGQWALLAMLKMLALFAVVWLLMRYEIVSPLAMLVGFGALPVGIAIGSLVSDRNTPP
jgi:hypothetical protein